MDRSTPTALRIKVARTLRTLREGAGISPGQAASVLACHRSKISRLELGEAPLLVHEVAQLLELYGLADDDPERLALLEDVRATQMPPWWHEYRNLVPPDEQRYLSLESDAGGIRVWAPYTVPDLLQTSSYAAALGSVSGTQGKTSRLRFLREARQSIARAPGRRLWVILDESALLRKVGNPDIMHQQADALVQSAKEPGIIIQVARLSAGAARGAGIPFTILRFDDRELPDTVWAETPGTSICTSKPADVDRYREVADGLAAAAERPEATPDIVEGIW
jgi:uncharacterized protein DUF5753/helix-turn-helix protein